jgi:predicted GIY-YIG superfamily endonuclease
MSIRPQKFQGIYQIKSIATDRLYIGYSMNIESRWYTHKRLLKSGKHYNLYLQSHYNKYGSQDLIFSIYDELPHLTSKEIIWKEEFYIKKFESHKKPNFNIVVGDEFRCSDLQKKPCKIMNIDTNEIKEFESIIDAADFIGIDRSSMSKILKGSKKQMKGWCSAELGYDQLELKRKNRVLYHKDYGQIKVGKNMCEFAKIYNLNEKIIHRLFTQPNKYKSHKGWTIYDSSIENKIHSRHRRVACYDKAQNIIKEFDFLCEAAKEYNCSPSSITQALKEPFVKTSMKLYWKYL